MHLRRLVLECAAIVLAFATYAGAHAVVIKASLDDAPVRSETPTQVTLHFNSRIEPGFTRVTLLGAGARERSLEVADANDPGTVVVALPALTAGNYALRYKVLATDGHVTENVLRFRVTSE